jgi:hypothetical protein
MKIEMNWVLSRRRIIISPSSNMKKKYEGLFFYPNSNFPPSLYSALYPSAHSLSPPPQFPCIAVYCMVCNLYAYIWLSKAVTSGVTPINPLLAGSLWPYMCDEYPNYHLSQAKQMLMAFFYLVVVYSCVLFDMNYSLSSLVRWWWQHVITKSHNCAITGALPCFIFFIFIRVISIMTKTEWFMAY